jgi:transcriptional regulator of acetoin/glycerol metabolism
MTLPWTGNVRELRNFAERVLAVGAARALAMATSDDAPTAASGAERRVAGPTAASIAAPAAAGGEIVPGGSSTSLMVDGPEGWFEAGFKDFRDRWGDIGEREYLRRLLLRTNRSTSQASKEAGVDRTYLYRLLRRHNI